MERAPLHEDIAKGPPDGRAFWRRTGDGVRIRLGHWPAQDKTGPGGTVLLFPGRTEYIEKYGPLAADLASAGLDTLAIDWRGQGLSDRLCRNPLVGHVRDYGEYQTDIAQMIATAEALELPRPWYLLAHSMGGCIGLRALHEGLPVERALFSAPMWGILIEPAALRPAAWGMSWLLHNTPLGCNRVPQTTRETYVSVAEFEDNQLTTNRPSWEFMVAQARARPELTLGGPSASWLHASLIETRRLMQMTPPQTPALTFLGSNERIVSSTAIEKHMRAWRGGRLELVTGAEHEVLMEGGEMRALFTREMLDFLQPTRP
jgi:lysophospholipase